MNPNLVSTVILVLAVAALWHGVYELIVLPTLRRDIRFKIFALRDRLRAFKAEHASQCSDDTFHLLDNMLSWQTDNLPRLTFSLLQRVDHLIRTNAELRSEVARRMVILNACKLNEYVAIRKESAALILRVLALNSGGWMIYLVPIVYPVVIWDTIRKRAQRLTVMPSEEVDHLQACPA